MYSLPFIICDFILYFYYWYFMSFFQSRYKFCIADGFRCCLPRYCCCLFNQEHVECILCSHYSCM